MFWWENLDVRNRLKDLCVDGTIIQKLDFKTGCVGIDKIQLAEDRNKRRAVVNMVTKIWVP